LSFAQLDTPKLDIYFGLLPETQDVEQTTILSRMKNLVKTCKNCGRNRSITDVLTETQTHRRTNWL